MQDLYSSDPTQETRATADHADYTASTRQREADHTDRESICPAWQIIQIMSCSAVVGTDDLSDLSVRGVQCHPSHVSRWLVMHRASDSVLRSQSHATYRRAVPEGRQLDMFHLRPQHKPADREPPDRLPFQSLQRDASWNLGEESVSYIALKVCSVFCTYRVHGIEETQPHPPFTCTGRLSFSPCASCPV